jgi:hypothetical protein
MEGGVVEYESVRRTPRYFLMLDIEITDVQSAAQIKARTKMLGLYGCGVESSTLFPHGTSLQVKLSHQGVDVKSFARVVYSTPALGMGLVFTSMEREDERILECWIAEYLSVPY